MPATTPTPTPGPATNTHHLQTLRRPSEIFYVGGVHFVAAGAQLVKIVKRRTGDRICACAEARNGNSLHVSVAGLPQDGGHDHQPGIGWCRGWAKATLRSGRRCGGWCWRHERRLCAGLGGEEAVRMERAEPGPGGWDSGTPLPATPWRSWKNPGSADRGRCGAGGGAVKAPRFGLL